MVSTKINIAYIYKCFIFLLISVFKKMFTKLHNDFFGVKFSKFLQKFTKISENFYINLQKKLQKAIFFEAET